MTNATAFEPVELLRVLCRHGVAFVAIGGFAAEVQGVSWSTLDLDIVIEDREENYTALAAALVDVDAWSRAARQYPTNSPGFRSPPSAHRNPDAAKPGAADSTS